MVRALPSVYVGHLIGRTQPLVGLDLHHVHVLSGSHYSGLEPLPDMGAGSQSGCLFLTALLDCTFDKSELTAQYGQWDADATGSGSARLDKPLLSSNSSPSVWPCLNAQLTGHILATGLAWTESRLITHAGWSRGHCCWT
jgi:hypothetical protein